MQTLPALSNEMMGSCARIPLKRVRLWYSRIPSHLSTFIHGSL
ncbi:hypothetical protein HMPREF1155_1094 [Slackia sp. CM382]|nr:hypothetical protein HMPREF1155_1094 [Slackia sp. CM382]